jgi:membrane protein DedA with SNARE-associated domain
MINMVGEWAITSLRLYGIPILLLVSFFGSLGIPFPITLVIVATGALTRQGLLDWRLAILACLAGASLADNSEYFLGRLSLARLKQRYGHKTAWQRADSTLNRKGGWAILLTRFWLTPLAPAVNIICGSRFPYARFLLFDLAGELLWVLLYGGLGYLFASEWKLVSQAISEFSGLSVAVVLVLGGIYLLVRRRNQSPSPRE